MNEFSLGRTHVFFRPVCCFLPKLKPEVCFEQLEAVPLQGQSQPGESTGRSDWNEGFPDGRVP